MELVFKVLEKILFTNLIGDIDTYTILSVMFKFIFVIIVLSFIYSIVKMMTLDIRSTLRKKTYIKSAYLKLLNDPREFDFPIRDEYYLTDNTTIGRSEDNSIVIKNKIMSKHQAQIVENGGRYFIDDKGSTNGTMVNNMVIDHPKELMDKDVISLGDISFLFMNGADDENR